MFQFTTFPSARYGFTYGYLRFAQVGFPIQTSPDRWLFAPPRSFSQLTTSFIGSQCQGILPVLFLAWPSFLTLARAFSSFRFGKLAYQKQKEKTHVALWRDWGNRRLPKCWRENHHHLFLNNSFVLGMIIYLSSFPFAWKIVRFSTSAPSFVLQRWSVASNRFETHWLAR